MSIEILVINVPSSASETSMKFIEISIVNFIINIIKIYFRFDIILLAR